MKIKILSYSADSRARTKDRVLEDDQDVIEGVRLVTIGPDEEDALVYDVTNRDSAGGGSAGRAKKP